MTKGNKTIPNNFTEFTQEQKDIYLKEKKGNLCPCCSSNNIIYEEPTSTDSNIIFQEVFCAKCHKQWFDLYTLTDIEFILDD